MANNNIRKLGNKIKELRTSKNITQDEFAKMVFVTKSTVSKWESGSVEPSLEMLMKISEVFGVTIESLISDANLTNNVKNDEIANTDSNMEIIVPKLPKKIWSFYVIAISMLITSIILLGVSAATYESSMGLSIALMMIGLFVILPIGCFVWWKGYKTEIKEHDLSNYRANNSNKKLKGMWVAIIGISFAFIGGILQIINYSQIKILDMDRLNVAAAFADDVNPIMMVIGMVFELLGGFIAAFAIRMEGKKAIMANKSFYGSQNKGLKIVYWTPSVMSVFIALGALSFVFFNLTNNTNDETWLWIGYIYTISFGGMYPLVLLYRIYHNNKNYAKIFSENPFKG